VLRRVSVDGKFGVMPELPSPVIDTRDVEDPIWNNIVMAIQSADQKRAADISAFWIHDGFDCMIIATALSRPQLQAIANQIEYNMRKKLRAKIKKTWRVHEYDIRKEASAGWVILTYNRLTIHIMTPVQRAYYDIEGCWRDDNKDYDPIDISQVLKEDSFGNVRLTKEIGGNMEGDEEEDDEYVEAPGIGGSSSYNSELYEEDEEDPFWS